MRDGRTVSEDVYEALRQDIICRRVEPGAKLALHALKDRYGASVSTLREVLNRLTSEGFADVEENRGYFVAGMSAGNLRELADLRELLEGHAIEKSLAAGDMEWEGAILTAHHKLRRMEEKTGSGEGSMLELVKRHDWEFHRALIMACGSAELIAAHGIVFEKFLRYQVPPVIGRGEEVAREHRALLEAALARDVARAREVLSRHVDGALQHSLRYFE